MVGRGLSISRQGPADHPWDPSPVLDEGRAQQRSGSPRGWQGYREEAPRMGRLFTQHCTEL